MSNKSSALEQIAMLVAQNKISIKEIARTIERNAEHSAKKNRDVAVLGDTKKLFVHVGSVLIFAGIATYIGIYWKDLNSIARIMLTLGTGVSLYVIAMLLFSFQAYKSLSSPIFLIATLYQLIGLFVLANEFNFFVFESSYLVILAILSLMSVQQRATYFLTRQAAPQFFSIIFAALSFTVLFDKLSVNYHLSNLTIATSIMLVSYAIVDKKQPILRAFLLLISSSIILFSSFELLSGRPYEVIYLIINAGILYVGIQIKSKLVQIVSTLALLSYVFYYSFKHFPESTSWPIGMVATGIIAFIISMILKNK